MGRSKNKAINTLSAIFMYLSEFIASFDSPNWVSQLVIFLRLALAGTNVFASSTYAIFFSYREVVRSEITVTLMITIIIIPSRDSGIGPSENYVIHALSLIVTSGTSPHLTIYIYI